MKDTLERTQVLQAVLKDISLFKDTCNVDILRRGPDAVLVDFGSGDVLDHLAGIDVDRVTDVVMTHHHPDQGQGPTRRRS